MTNEELVLAIRAGHDVTENMEQLYNQNKGMIFKLTEKYKGVEDLQDLRQESYFGLVRAVELWDPDRDAQFLTFAFICIKTVLYQYITECGALIRIPPNQKTLISKYDRIMNAYRVELGRDATPEELRIFLGLSKDQFEQLKKDRLTTRLRSTNEVIGGDDEDITLEDTLPADGDQFEDALERIQREELSRELWAQVDKLPEREADVVRSKYQLGETYIQCGERLGVSGERVRQLHERALRSLRKRQVTKRLIPYLTDSTAYSIGTRFGVSTFKRTHTTGPEYAVMRLEEYAGPIWANYERILYDQSDKKGESSEDLIRRFKNKCNHAGIKKRV